MSYLIISCIRWFIFWLAYMHMPCLGLCPMCTKILIFLAVIFFGLSLLASLIWLITAHILAQTECLYDNATCFLVSHGCTGCDCVFFLWQESSGSLRLVERITFHSTPPTHLPTPFIPGLIKCLYLPVSFYLSVDLPLLSYLLPSSPSLDWEQFNEVCLIQSPSIPNGTRSEIHVSDRGS